MGGAGRKGRGGECDKPKGCIGSAPSGAHQHGDWNPPFSLLLSHHVIRLCNQETLRFGLCVEDATVCFILATERAEVEIDDL